MGPMLWAALVAAGVAVATMTVFAARLTRRNAAGPAPEEDFVPSTDPEDPWAAYRPRPFDEIERRRPRMWPAVAGVFGLVLVAGGVVGARQSTELTGVNAAPTAKPYIVDVRPAATPKPAPAVTAAPKIVRQAQPVRAAAPAPKRVAAAPVASGAGPKISGFVSCTGGTLSVSVQLSGTSLDWFGLYLDGKVVKGGPISGSSYSSSYSKPAVKGDHTAEATVEDKAGRFARKIFTARCP